MVGIEIVFIAGLLLGGFLGWLVGGRSLLYKMRNDERKGVDLNYRRRQEKYLGKRNDR